LLQVPELQVCRRMACTHRFSLRFISVCRKGPCFFSVGITPNLSIYPGGDMLSTSGWTRLPGGAFVKTYKNIDKIGSIIYSESNKYSQVLRRTCLGQKQENRRLLNCLTKGLSSLHGELAGAPE
jgi:hypothetical protein